MGLSGDLRLAEAPHRPAIKDQAIGVQAIGVQAIVIQAVGVQAIGVQAATGDGKKRDRDLVILSTVRTPECKHCLALLFAQTSLAKWGSY